MTIETTENFWKAFATQVKQTEQKIEYRLYYDENGNPLYFSMEDLPGNYIVIDRETYVKSPTNIKVIDKKLIQKQTTDIHKLIPSKNGIACAISNICIVVSENEPHIKWEEKYYE